MKVLFTILLAACSVMSFAQLDTQNNEISKNVPLCEESEKTENEEFEPFSIQFDWMLDTKTEIINGIWYSPMIEFNLNAKNGFTFQFQTAALPTLKGFMINKTQPSAGLSIGYRF